jgi:hypothetical protein
VGRPNKDRRANANRRIVAAIKKHLGGAVILEGVTYAPSALAKLFQRGIDVADATDSAKKTWHVAVATEQEETQNIWLLQQALRSHVTAVYGAKSVEFADFGFATKAKPVDVATKVEAVKKSAATRAARHTMGKRQKEKVRGEVSLAGDGPNGPTPPEAPGASGGAPAPNGASPKNGAAPA